MKKITLPFCPTCGKPLGELEITVYLMSEPDETEINDIDFSYNRICDCKADVRFGVKDPKEEQPK